MSSYSRSHLTSTRLLPAFDSLCVIVSVKDGEAFPQQTVASVTHQLAPRDQLLLVGEGLTHDNTIELICASEEDDRILVVSVPGNRGGEGQNAALDFASSNYVLLLNAGQELQTGALDEVRSTIRSSRNPDMILAGAGFSRGSSDGNLSWDLSESPVERLLDGLLSPTSPGRFGLVAFRKAALGKEPFPTHVEAGHCLPVVAQMLFAGTCVAIPTLTFEAEPKGLLARHPRLTPKICHQLVNEIFDRLPAEAQHLKATSLSESCLVGCAACLAGKRYGEARRFFFQAVRWSPRRVCRWGALKNIPKLCHW